jgi:hypothetical protein
LTDYCKDCQTYKPLWLTYEYQAKVEIKRGIFIGRIGHDMTDEEKLFAKFYNEDVILVKDMDDAILREHRKELSEIAFEAKARLVATDDEIRTRNGKNGKHKEWLTSITSDEVSSDVINAVKVRASRMSKMDKMRKDLLAAGIDKDTVDEMVRNMERKATEAAVKTLTFKSPEAKPEQKETIVFTDRDKVIAVVDVSDSTNEVKPNPFAQLMKAKNEN